MSGGNQLVLSQMFANTALGEAIHRAHARGAVTVSYTHLRAHETVLDLVCRLLLEKKNNNNTNCTVRLTSQTTLLHI